MGFWDEVDALAEQMHTKTLAAGSIPPAGVVPAGTLYQQLRAAGLDAGLRPSWETIQAIAPIIAASGLSQTDACLIQAWLGGAHDRADPAACYKRSRSGCELSQQHSALL